MLITIPGSTEKISLKRQVTNMLTFLGRLIEIIVTNAVALLTFYFIYQYGVSIAPELENYYQIPLFINIVFLIYQDIKILQGK